MKRLSVLIVLLALLSFLVLLVNSMAVAGEKPTTTTKPGAGVDIFRPDTGKTTKTEPKEEYGFLTVVVMDYEYKRIPAEVTLINGNEKTSFSVDANKDATFRLKVCKDYVVIVKPTGYVLKEAKGEFHIYKKGEQKRWEVRLFPYK